MQGTTIIETMLTKIEEEIKQRLNAADVIADWDATEEEFCLEIFFSGTQYVILRLSQGCLLATKG